MGRQACGVEINEAYCEVAARWLERQGVLNFSPAAAAEVPIQEALL